MIARIQLAKINQPEANAISSYSIKSMGFLEILIIL